VIYSSSDILSVLTGDPVIRALADVKVVEKSPSIEASSKVAIYIAKYAVLTEFEATWNIWIIDVNNEPIDIIINQLKLKLPGFKIISNGAIIKASVTDLKSSRTEQLVKKEPSGSQILEGLRKQFEDLKQSIEDRMLLVGPGRPGKDGKDGIDGKDGRNGSDGKNGNDLLATDAELDNLKDVFVKDAQKGQFLMFDGSSWVARFVPQLFKTGGGGGAGGGGTGGGIEEAPLDGNFYVRRNGQWVDLGTAIGYLNNLDAGNFTTGIAETVTSTEYDGGDFTP
jgi:hypothetical protein